MAVAVRDDNFSNNNKVFQWTSDECECKDDSMRDSSFRFYRSFELNNETYREGDFVIVPKLSLSGQSPRSRIGKLVCLYESEKSFHTKAPYRATVRWYERAEDLISFYRRSRLEPDKNYEIVEDLRDMHTFISLLDVRRKCHVTYCDPNETPKTDDYQKQRFRFFCKYRLEANRLVPIRSDLFSNGVEVLKAINVISQQYQSPVKKFVSPLKIKLTKIDRRSDSDLDDAEVLPRKYSAKKVLNDKERSYYKRRASVNNAPANDDEEREELENFTAVRSPRSPTKILRLTPSKTTNSGKKSVSKKVFTPVQKDGVKRNLNSSFTQSPDVKSPHLNYSIVENVEDEAGTPIKMKLKVSSKCAKPIDTSPSIMLKRLSISDRHVNNLIKDDDKKLLGLSDGSHEGKMHDQPKRTSRVSFCEKTVSEQDSKEPETESSDDERNKQRPKRQIRRVSYADFVSPQEEKQMRTPQRKSQRRNSVEPNDSDFTPRRSHRRTSIDSAKNLQGTPRRSARKNLHVIRETEKNYPSDDDVPLTATPKKKTAKTPVKKTPSKKTPKKSLTKRESSDLDSETEQESPSKRSVKTPSKLKDFQIVKPKRNTRGYYRKLDESDIGSECDSDFKEETKPKKRGDSNKTPKKTPRKCLASPMKTPKSSRLSAAATPKSILKNTPSSRARLIREGIIQPSVQNRDSLVPKCSTPLSQARSQLHVSYVPKSLPCREKEFDDVYNFLEGKLDDKCGGCMYISGVPGTGKTATVTEVIRSLQCSAKKGNVPDFTYVNINGMRLSEPRQAYVEILKQLTGKTLAWEQAHSILENRFTKATKKTIVPTVLVVDELDILCTKRQDVVYNLLDWPTKSNAQLIVVTIANTMDLPERLLMSRVTSRLGLTRLTFQAYTHKQLQEIVMKRLTGTNAFNPDAVQLVARKVASVSGDARRALDICRRAAEIAETEGESTLVSMKHINDALNMMITQPKVQAIKHCSRLEQLVLQAVVAEVERTGVEETCFEAVYRMLPSVAALDGFRMVSVTVALNACSRLGSSRLLLVDKTDLYQKIILNVSADDVYYALKDD